MNAALRHEVDPPPEETALPGSAMQLSLDESYALCRQAARRSASNFYYPFLLLPRRKRAAMCALYAFLRKTDDLGDEPQSGATAREALAGWRRSFRRALQGTYDDPILPALADTVRKFAIPPECLEAVISGVETDLDHQGFETVAELEEYCRHVASAVGLACIHIWGFTSPAALRPAERCGLAFQWTNILRDLKEDAARGRIYLPREDLRRFDYAPADLHSGVCDERFRRLMACEISRAEQYYAEAAELERWLHADGRRIFRAMMAVYGGLLAEIRRADGDVWSRRIRLPGWRKAWIAAGCLTSWACGAGRNGAVPAAFEGAAPR